MEFTETLVVGNGAKEFEDMPQRLRPDRVVVNFARVSRCVSDERYKGVCR